MAFSSPTHETLDPHKHFAKNHSRLSSALSFLNPFCHCSCAYAHFQVALGSAYDDDDQQIGK